MNPESGNLINCQGTGFAEICRVLAISALSLCLAGYAIGQEPGQPGIDRPLPATEAARTMLVPEGFRVALFAGEPDCQQPIGFCIDDRARVWVAEAYNYPKHGTRSGDRIVIFEDVDSDGRFDRRTVFYDKLNYVTGIEVGFGGVWVMSPPFFFFIPDRNGDDKPDSDPIVLLDGFGNHANSHNLANGFAWGPDGWLYGTHGRTNWSMIGKPGALDNERTRFDGGVYRYHPVKHLWEPYADGTTNPWGIDWNDVGEAFVCNCVNPHLFHVIPGAHYEPWRNRESSQYAYQRIPSIADHLHFVGKNNVRDGLGSDEEDHAGGGHAHCGSMVYLGDNWPDKYRNTFFTNNIHGRRINNDILKRSGSGYVASHGQDLMRSRDPWYMGVTLRYGPDGSVFASDWSDTGECHSVTNTRRTTGRIYKISYGVPPKPVDPTAMDDLQLVDLQLHRNDWYVQHSRKLLQERAAAGNDMSQVARKLEELFRNQRDVSRQLRALWALHVIGKLEPQFLERELSNPSEYIRAWALRLLTDSTEPSTTMLSEFQRLAATDQSPLVRLHLASSLQRLPFVARWRIAEALIQREEDRDDSNLPLMIWYGIEPLVTVDMERFVALVKQTKLPLIARHIARRVSSIPENKPGIASLVATLNETIVPNQSELLAGMLEGLEGQRSVGMPAEWAKVYPLLSAKAELREPSLQLALVFSDPKALGELQRIALDTSAESTVRNRALRSLIGKRPPETPSLLIELIKDPATRRTAIQGLAEFNHPKTASHLMQADVLQDATSRQDVISTLSSRLPWASELLDAVETGKIPRSDLTAYTARQLVSLKDSILSERVKKLWGELRTTSEEKSRLILEFKKRLTVDSIRQSNRSAGRALFQKSCANCHRLFDAGGSIGPDITGAQRMNLDYLLQTLIDPNAAISKYYQLQVIETTGGRIITGLVISETKSAVTIQTVNEKVVVPAAEIEERSLSSLSMMPEGLLQNLSIAEVRSLFAYLMGTEQVPLPH